MKDKKKDIKVYSIIAICIIILLSIVYYQFNTNDKAYYIAYNIEDVKGKYNSTVENITEGLEVGQTFKSQNPNLAKIYINFNKMADIKNRNSIGGGAIIGLQDEKGNIVKEEEMAYNHVRTNNIYKFEFPVQKDSEGKQYYLYIRFLELDKKYTTNFSINYSKEDVYEHGNMYLDHQKMDGDIYFQELYYNPIMPIFLYLVTAIVTISAVGLIILVYRKKDITAEKLFLLIVPAIFACSLIIMPTMKNHDEIFHWLRIYDISQGHILTEMVNGEPKSTTAIEVSKIRIHDNPVHLMYADLKEQFSYKITDDSTKVITTLSTTAIYNPIQYLPQAIGTFIADIFTDYPMVMAYFARIFNMIVTAILLYLALKCMPYGKKILLLLMCIPIAVEGFVSMSPDAMTISVAFLFIAYVLKLFNEKEKKVTKKDKIVLFILSIVIALCKIVYLPIVGLLLILPRDKFKTRKEQIVTVGLIIGLAIFANLAWLVVSTTYLVTFRGGDSTYQMSNLLAHPIKYIQMLFNTINNSGNDYLYTMFGGQLGWDEYAEIYSIVPFIFGMLYVFFSSTDEELKNKFNKYQTIIILLILLAVTGLIFTSLYIQWTPVTYDVIAGIQGRYFIPILPLFSLAVLGKIKTKNEYKEEKKLKVLGILTLVLYVYIFMTIFLNNI